MKLAVFDLDDTLASTFAVDEECFIQAFEQSLGIKELNTNWSEYPHVTDSGVVHDAFVKAFGCAPARSEISKFVECFLDLLSRRHGENNEHISEVPGAARLLENFLNYNDCLRSLEEARIQG